MNINLEKLKEIQEDLFKKQCDLDIQKAMVKHFINKRETAISVTRCCEEFADGKCKPMVNADWTYLRCECGKRLEPKG
jgi:hypothetical protein